MEDANCDTLAKDEAVRVFAIRSDADRSSLARSSLAEGSHFNTSVEQDELVPSITATGDNNILISITRVSYIYKKDTLIGRTVVAYDI